MMRKVFVMVVPLLVDERVKNLSNIRCWGRGFVLGLSALIKCPGSHCHYNLKQQIVHAEIAEPRERKTTEQLVN